VQSIKSNLTTTGKDFDEGHLELNEKVFHTLASLALNDSFREQLKGDKQLLKNLINELQIENLIKVEGFEDRMNKILICLNNLL